MPAKSATIKVEFLCTFLFGVMMCIGK